MSLLKSSLTSLRHYPDMHVMSTSGMKGNVISTHPKCVLVTTAKMQSSFNVKERTTTLDTLLSCPFHSFAYEIECHERALMSEQLVHATLKRGHSNWLEASHSAFIHFRPKHIHLEGLHYVVSTELALSIMTYKYHRCGPQHHWLVELFRHLNLPVFDGVCATLEAFNKLRKEILDKEKTGVQKEENTVES